MSPALQNLWMLPLDCLKWGVTGALVVVATAVLLLLAEIIYEHWRIGQDIDDDRGPPL